MLLPMAQKHLFKFAEKPLSGDVRLAPDNEFSIEDWFDGSYPLLKEKYVNDNFGFRNTFLRIKSQVYYSLLGDVTAKDVVVGKDGYLYELKYLQAYAGTDCLPDKEVQQRFEKIKFIQEELAKKNIHFALLFAPSKARYYPEYNPNGYAFASSSNYAKFVAEAKKRGINHIDYNSIFSKLKAGSKYPLYPKTGTHWSVYGMYVAFDTLNRYMENLSGIKLPQFDYSQVETIDTLRTPDGDIAEGLNLLFEPKHLQMGYPVIKWKDSAQTKKPNVLTVSDSYWMGIYFHDLPKNTFNKHEFWYYNRQLFHYDPQGKTTDPGDQDLRSSVEKNDFVFIMATDASFKQMGWGFIDDVYSMYKHPESYAKMQHERKRNAEIAQTEMAIQNDPEWYKTVVQQAKQLNIEIDSAIRSNAEYNYFDKHKNDPVAEESPEQKLANKIETYENLIRSDKVWLQKIAEKAKEKKISLDESIRTDATWMAEEELHLPHIDPQLYKELVAGYKKSIRSDKKWLNEVTQKAKEKGISVDSSISIDANWMAKQQLEKK